MACCWMDSEGNRSRLIHCGRFVDACSEAYHEGWMVDLTDVPTWERVCRYGLTSEETHSFRLNLAVARYSIRSIVWSHWKKNYIDLLSVYLVTARGPLIVYQEVAGHGALYPAITGR